MRVYIYLFGLVCLYYVHGKPLLVEENNEITKNEEISFENDEIINSLLVKDDKNVTKSKENDLIELVEHVTEINYFKQNLSTEIANLHKDILLKIITEDLNAEINATNDNNSTEVDDFNGDADTSLTEAATNVVVEKNISSKVPEEIPHVNKEETSCLKLLDLDVMMDELEAIDIQRNSRELKAEILPLIPHLIPSNHYSNSEYTAEEISDPLISMPVQSGHLRKDAPKKQVLPVKSKLTIIGRFTDFKWNIPSTNIPKMMDIDKEVYYDDNIAMKSVPSCYNVHSPRKPFYNNIHSSYDNIQSPDMPFYNNIHSSYDNIHSVDVPFQTAKKSFRGRVPASGKVIIAATFGGNCKFME